MVEFEGVVFGFDDYGQAFIGIGTAPYCKYFGREADFGFVKSTSCYAAEDGFVGARYKEVL